jgi:hypothetical protein
MRYIKRFRVYSFSALKTDETMHFLPHFSEFPFNFALLSDCSRSTGFCKRLPPAAGQSQIDKTLYQ